MNLNMLRLYWRELSFGFLMCLLSSFGQTFFISLSASEIKSAFSISDGEFGTLYSMGTFASAIILVWSGRLVDRLRLATMATIVLIGLGLTCVSMGFVWEPVGLTIVIMCLRHFGQGLSYHTGVTSVARRFSTLRGRALSVVSIGITAGEAFLPILVVTLLTFVNWRHIWIGAGVVLFLTIYGVRYLVKRHQHAPEEGEEGQIRSVATGENHTLKQVFADPGLWLRLPALLASSFIFTGLFLHQVALVESKGWSMIVWSSSYVIFAGCSLATTLYAGHLVDKFTARRLVMFMLVPMIISCLVLATSNSPIIITIFMALMGVNSGFSNIVGTAIWAELYGNKNLGAIKAFAQAASVFSSGLGPITVGLSMDGGISIETIALAAIAYSVLASLLSMLAKKPKPLSIGQ